MKHQSILIVDKEPKNLNILENNFVEANFQVDKATSDYEAIKNLSSRDYDIILSEVTGPSIDGYFILEHLQRNSTKADTPVVFLTQKSDIWNRVKSFRLGAKDYIIKPMHVKEIVARVNMLLKRIEKQSAEEILAKKKFTGRLEDFNLADLIETFSIEKKTGILSLVSENGTSGTVYFNKGSVVNADVTGLLGQAAIFKMMPWNKGRFSMLFTDVSIKDSTKISNLGLLLEGARRMEQRDELLRHIPSLDAVVVTTSNFKKILDKKALSQDLKEFLELFDGERTIGRIIDESTEDELTILNRIAKLSNLGFLHVLRDFRAESAQIDDDVLEPISSQTLEKETKSIFAEENYNVDTETNIVKDPFGQEDYKEPVSGQSPTIPVPEDEESPLNEPAEQEDLKNDYRSGWDDTKSWPQKNSLDKEDMETHPIDEMEKESPIIFENTIDKSTTTKSPFDEFAEIPEDFDTDKSGETLEDFPETKGPAQTYNEKDNGFETGEKIDFMFPDNVPSTDQFELKNSDLKFSMDDDASEQFETETPFLSEALDVEEQNDPFLDFRSHVGEEIPAMETEREKGPVFENDTKLGFEEHPVDELLKLPDSEDAEKHEAIMDKKNLAETADLSTTTKVESIPEETSLKEEIQKRHNLAKGNILVLGTGELNRKKFIDSLVGKYTTSTEIGVQNVSSIYHGTAEFKGNHFLNLISFSIKNEFTPVVEYFSQKALAYILIVDEDKPDWSYLNYLLNVFRNKLNKPAKLIFTN